MYIRVLICHFINVKPTSSSVTYVTVAQVTHNYLSSDKFKNVWIAILTSSTQKNADGTSLKVHKVYSLMKLVFIYTIFQHFVEDKMNRHPPKLITIDKCSSYSFDSTSHFLVMYFIYTDDPNVAILIANTGTECKWASSVSKICFQNSVRIKSICSPNSFSHTFIGQTANYATKCAEI